MGGWVGGMANDADDTVMEVCWGSTGSSTVAAATVAAIVAVVAVASVATLATEGSGVLRPALQMGAFLLS